MHGWNGAVASAQAKCFLRTWIQARQGEAMLYQKALAFPHRRISTSRPLLSLSLCLRPSSAPPAHDYQTIDDMSARIRL